MGDFNARGTTPQGSKNVRIKKRLWNLITSDRRRRGSEGRNHKK